MGVIRGGKYYPDELPTDSQVIGVASIARNSRIDRDYEEHAQDLIQPYNPDGTPNQDFIDYYPEQAKDYGFIPEEE